MTEFTSGNHLAPARRRGSITRRELIERAFHLGLAAPAAGGLLLASGDRARADPPVIATAPTASYAVPVEDGHVTAGVVSEFDVANPYLIGLTSLAAEPMSGVMDGLIGYDSRQLLHPGLAEGFEVADDGVTYTFHLRSGVVFHNGDALASRDVIASWEMIVNADLPAPIRTGWDEIASINAPDARTVVVKTRQPYGPFLSNIAAGAFNCSAISPAGVLAQGARAFAKTKTPIGTGPFKVASWSSTLVELERFAAHWAGAASIAQLSVRSYADDDALLAALEKGEIQIAHRIGAPGKSRVKDAAELSNVNVLGFPGNAWAHLDLKQIDLLQNRTVRQALDHATPTDEIIATILYGEAVRAYADQEPGSWAFQNAGRPRDYSLDRARELLQVAGLRAGKDGVLAKNGVELAIELWGDQADPTAKPILTLIAQRWNEIGVRATVHLDDAVTIWGAGGYQFTKKMTAGYYRWTNYNDPDDRYYWHSSSIPAKPGAPGGNAPAFFHPYSFQAQIDDLTTRAAAETDQARRKALYWQIQDLLADEAPVIFLFWDLRYSACAANLSGFWPSSFTSLLWNARDWQPTQP